MALFSRTVLLKILRSLSQRAHESNAAIIASQHVSDELCMICSLINTRKRMKKCSNCNLWALLTCVKLTHVQADSIPIWLCQPCLSRGTGDAAFVATDAASLNVPPEGWADALAALKKSVPLLPRIPKSVRGVLEEKLAITIEAVLPDSTEISWWNLI